MSKETMPQTNQKTSSDEQLTIFGSISADQMLEPQDDYGESQLNPTRLGAEVLDYAEVGLYKVAKAIEATSNWLADRKIGLQNRRTASQVVSDRYDLVKTQLSEYKNQKFENTTEKLKLAKIKAAELGSKASDGLVNIATAPLRAGERAGEKLANKMESSLNKLETRAQNAKARKQARLTEKATAKEAKKQAREQKIYELHQKAEQARIRKRHRKQTVAARRQQKSEARVEKMDALKVRNQARLEKVRSKASRIGRSSLKAANVVYRGSKNIATGMGVLFTEAGREARDVTSEIAAKAKSAAKVQSEQYHATKGHKAAQKAAKHLNKSTSSGKYKVPVLFEDDKN